MVTSGKVARPNATSSMSLAGCLKGAAGNATKILSIVRKAEKATCERSELSAVYAAAIDAYKCPKAADDSSFQDLCVKHMRLLCELNVNEAREFHNRQRAFGIHGDARIYEARAELEEQEGDVAKALKMLNEGLRVGAQPTELLRERIADLERRTSPATELAEEPEPESHEALMELVDESPKVYEPLAAKSGTSGRKSGATLQLLHFRHLEQLQEQLLSQHCLLESFTAWRAVLDQVAQRRREALFESLREQTRAAQRRAEAAEGALRLAGRLDQRQSAYPPKLLFRAWSSLSVLSRQHRKLADVAYQDEVRRRALQVLLAWRGEALSSHRQQPEALEPDDTVQEDKTPCLESLLDELSVPSVTDGRERTASSPPRKEALQARPARLSRCRSAPVDCPAFRQAAVSSTYGVQVQPAGKPSSSMSPRQPLGQLQGNSHEAPASDADGKRVKGPERFFYDTSSYTGCARFGGPLVVDKKENRTAGQWGGPKQAAQSPAAAGKRPRTPLPR